MFKINYITKRKIFLSVKNFLRKFNFHLFYYKEKNYFEKLQIDNIIDVGVAYGTEFLTKNFPEARFFLVEPNPIFFNYIETNILNKYKCKLFKLAAGNEFGEKSFYFSGGISSFIQREDYKIKKEIKVNIDTLDNILKNENLVGTNLLKVDTEGYELEVLKGAQNILNIIDYIVLEVRLENIKTYNPSEVINFLFTRNFYFYKILKINYYNDGISYLDIMFTKKK